MKYLSYLLFFALSVSVISCDNDGGEDDEMMDTDPVYSITIMSPDAEAKKVGDDIHIHVNFDEASLGTVHHVKVEIVEKDNESNVLFSGPSEAHVHEESGHHEFHADVNLSGADVEGHSNWILRAKVWGHEAGKAEVEKELEFHLHPAGPRYTAAIMSPNTDDKKVGDDIHIHVNFDEADMGTVHHAKVRIYQKDNVDNVIFEGPTEAHVHEESGHYELHADLTLSGTGIEGHTDWIVEAKVWGHEAGLGEVVETLEFHLHPE